ncbi:hypothetical protein KO529_21995 [Arenibacter algicola]|uniref:imm11 family protein n=1 Tax=Arenibacter algicola TaxID=616991 RepID=UPI001C078E25|nr:DUF1629 domain-containing protein [Arenibacter algicola]MBU2907489.1 hypothetical protein [Arenibacter algicola]
MRNKTMNERFTIWNFKDIDNAYVPYNLTDAAGESFDGLEVFTADDAPGDLQFTADPDYPNDFLMLDSFGNTECVIPISPKLKTFLEDKQIPNLLFIPVKMLDHKNRTLEEYYLLHSTEVIDAIDKTLTQLRVDRLNEDMFNRVKNLTLLDANIPADIQIFRVKGLYDVTCVSKALAKEIDDNGFTGIEWEETSEYSY